MEIRTIGIIGQGALGVMYGNHLTKKLGNEHVFFIADETRVERYRKTGMSCNGEKCGFTYRSPAEAVTDLFDRTGLSYQVPDDILREQWNKLMLNTGVNQVTAVYGAPYSLIQKEGEARTMMIEAMREVLRVADTQDVDLSEADISYWLDLLATLNPDGHTSMCQDVLAGRPTEVELFAGTMLKIAEEEGLSLPVNAFLYERLKELETAED